MRITTATATVTALLALTVAGCSGPAEPTVTPPPATTSGTASEPIDVTGEDLPRTPSTPPPAVKTTDLKLGSTVTIPASEDAPVVTVRAIARKKLPNYGDPVQAILVRVCIGTGPTADPEGYPVSTDPWSLLLDGGESQVNDMTSGGQEPHYPLWEPRIVKPGKCAKGWINFTEVPGRPEAVQYDNGEIQASWKLP